MCKSAGRLERNPFAKRLDHISVCICTFKRPELLALLLNELAHQSSEDLFDYSVVVVDNDADGSARTTVSSAINRSSLRIQYDVEPIQNIALARNRAIRNAEGNHIAFIDDDEIPGKNWLLSLYKALHHFGVDGVLGPVLPYFRVNPPAWVKRGRLYHRPTYPTGFIIDGPKGRTGNILLRKDLQLLMEEVLE